MATSYSFQDTYQLMINDICKTIIKVSASNEGHNEFKHILNPNSTYPFRLNSNEMEIIGI